MDFEKVIVSMVDGIEQKNIDLYKQLIKETDAKACDDPERFYFDVLYPFENFVDGCLAVSLSNNQARFLFSHYGFIENHLSNLFAKFEGSACSCDKSSFVINYLLVFYTKNKRLAFNYNGEYTYHLPKTILNNHDAIIEFYGALKGLYYGNPDAYLKSMLSFAKSDNDGSDDL